MINNNTGLSFTICYCHRSSPKLFFNIYCNIFLPEHTLLFVHKYVDFITICYYYLHTSIYSCTHFVITSERRMYRYRLTVNHIYIYTHNVTQAITCKSKLSLWHWIWGAYLPANTKATNIKANINSKKKAA